MGSYDDRVCEAKQAMTRMIVDLDKADTRVNAMDVARVVEDLNKAWDELTNCLVRQRTERDSQIRRLIDELAEAKKGR